MKFVVHRTYGWIDSDDPPCEGAKREIIECKTGKRKLWTIEINTIEELLKLINDEKTDGLYDGIVVNTPETDGYTGYPMIEIYDGYRE